MTVSRRDALWLGSSLSASAFLLTSARGQAPGSPAGLPPRMDKDPLLAACLLIGGREQIENCSFALTKLTNGDAKAFAQAEINEHQTIKADLQKLGFMYPVTPLGQPGGASGAGGWAVAIGKAPLSPDAAAQVAVDHEVADQCIANYRKEMDPLSGAKLDKRFVGNQLDMHFMLRDQAQTFRRNATPGMATVLDNGLTVIEAHIATLKSLMEKLETARG